MDVSLYQAAAAMNATSRWQEVISENLAASQIPGFKKQELSFSAVQAGFLDRAPRALPGTAGHFLMPMANTATNFQAGELRPTGDTTDLALDGPGLLEVQMPDGTHGYTRDGHFQVSPQGQLVTRQGFLLLGEGGPIQLDPNNTGPVTVAPTGEVTQGGQLKGKLKLSEFNDLAALTPVGTGLFVAPDTAGRPRAALTTQVRQGFVENANTSSMMEMSNLITATRFYEANQKVIQSQDERLGRLIAEVANPS